MIVVEHGRVATGQWNLAKTAGVMRDHVAFDWRTVALSECPSVVPHRPDTKSRTSVAAMV